MESGKHGDATYTDRLSDLLTVIVPVKNEAEAIGPVIDELLKVGVPRDKIIVVDGHSDDGTREIAASKGVIVVEQDGDGKADAVRKGVELAKTPYVLVMDGDYTYPARHVWELLKKALERRCDGGSITSSSKPGARI
jgi:glycosyltransferase involved in cell wall biosynthesis